MHLSFRLLFGLVIVILLASSPPKCYFSAQTVPVSQLTTMQTAEPIGKGGSNTSIGFFQYSTPRVRPDPIQDVVIGGLRNLTTFHLKLRPIFYLSDLLTD